MTRSSKLRSKKITLTNMSTPAGSGPTPTQEHSTVRNTLEKEKSQGVDEIMPDAAIREFCDKHYDQLLPLMAEKVHQEKLRQVQTRLDFNNDDEKGGKSRSSGSKNLAKAGGKLPRQSSPSTKSGPSEYSRSQSIFSRLSNGEDREQQRLSPVRCFLTLRRKEA